MDEKVTPVVTPIEERLYVMPPHPVAAPPLTMETTTQEEPISAEESVADLIEVAVAGLRTELRAELQSELQIERAKEIDFNAKN